MEPLGPEEKNMTIAELGALGEFTSAIAVVITLVYLAIQMKHTRLGLEANTMAVLGASEVKGNESTMRQLISVYSDESMVEIIIRASQSLDDLTPQDYARVNLTHHTGFQLHQITYLQWKKELLDDEYWSFCIRFFGGLMLSQPGVQQWWKLNRETYTRGYRNLVDALIKDHGWNDPSAYLVKPV